MGGLLGSYAEARFVKPARRIISCSFYPLLRIVCANSGSTLWLLLIHALSLPAHLPCPWAPFYHADGYRFNDGKVTPKGTLLVGRMSTRWRDGEPGRLYRLDPGSSVLVEVMGPSEVMLPNGIAWDESKPGVVYYIDSRTEAVRAYTADAEGVPLRDPSTGQLGYRTVTHRPNDWKTVPDGMTIDADGRLWVAHGESGAVTQYDPETGEVLRTVALPAQRPTACTFGGLGLEELYVTTRVEKGEGASPHHGGLFRIRIPGVRGAAPAYDYPLS